MVADDAKTASAVEPIRFDRDSLGKAVALGDMSVLRLKEDAVPATGGRGRPRSREAHVAILRATLALLLESGFDGVSVEAIAQQAKVSKATIYRRWESKEAIVLELLESIAASHDLPDTGDTRTDLVLFLGNVINGMGSTQYGGIITGLAAQLQRQPGLAETFRQRFLLPRRNASLELLQRGIDRGDIRPDVDLELVIDLFIGPLYYRRMITGVTFDEGLAERMADHILGGIATEDG